MLFRKIPGRQLTHTTENSTVQNHWTGVDTEDTLAADFPLTVQPFLNPHDWSAASPAVLYNLHIASWKLF